jgi:DNA-binding HxlR family transcriptional regulator
VTDSNRTLTGWETVDDEQCRRATSIVELVGRRWSSGIMLALSRGATRFSEIVSTVDGLSDRMASVRLKELEHGGLIDRLVEPTTPVTIRYRLSARGRDLLASLQPLQQYGQRWE